MSGKTIFCTSNFFPVTFEMLSGCFEKCGLHEYIVEAVYRHTHITSNFLPVLKLTIHWLFNPIGAEMPSLKNNYACTVALHLTIQLLIAYSIKTDEQETYIGRPQNEAIDLIQLTEEGRSAAFIIR